MQMQIRQVLKAKGGTVQTVAPDAMVIDAVRTMNDHGIGALVVTDGGKVVGMFTERDVLRRIVSEARDATSTPVRKVMTTNVVVVSPDVTVEQALSIVTQKRCRHLPVMEGGEMVGLISSGDLTKWVTRDQEQDIQDLIEYIHGPHVAESVPPPAS